MDYGDIFKRGFQHTWNNKFLYILGFLAALGGSGGSGGGGGGNFNIPNNGSTSGGSSEIEEFFRDFGVESANFETMIQGIVGAAIAVVCVLVIFRIVMWFIRLIAEGGMIHAVHDIENGGTSNFKQAFADGRKHMVDFFVVKLIFLIVPVVLMLIVGALIGIPLMMSAGSGNVDESLALVIIPIVCLVCLFIPYNLLVGLLYPIAQRGIIFKGLSGWDSVKYGWEFLKENTSDTLIMALLLTVMGFIVGIVSLIISLPILFATGWSAFSTLIGGDIPSFGQFAILGVGVILMIILGSIVNAVYIAFRSSSFTLAYLQLDGPKTPESIDNVPTPDPAPPTVVHSDLDLDDAVDVNTLKSDQQADA